MLSDTVMALDRLLLPLSYGYYLSEDIRAKAREELAVLKVKSALADEIAAWMTPYSGTERWNLTDWKKRYDQASKP